MNPYLPPTETELSAERLDEYVDERMLLRRRVVGLAGFAILNTMVSIWLIRLGLNSSGRFTIGVCYAIGCLAILLWESRRMTPYFRPRTS
jgi:hypothetical protein